MEQNFLLYMTAEKTMNIELVKTFRTPHDAMMSAFRSSAKQDKEFYLEMKLDPSQWTRIKNGTVNLPLNLVVHFSQIAESNLLIEKIAYDAGYELRPIPKVLEETIQDQKNEIDNLKRELNYFKNLLIDKKEKSGKMLKIVR